MCLEAMRKKIYVHAPGSVVRPASNSHVLVQLQVVSDFAKQLAPNTALDHPMNNRNSFGNASDK
jgi:hypothetical protein